MEVKIGKWDVIWNFMGTFFNVGYNIILLPFVYGLLDIEQLGIWYVFTAVSNFALLFDMGFSATMARNIAYCYSGVQGLSARGINNEKRNNNTINKKLLDNVLFSSRLIYLVIAVVIFVLLQTIGVFYIETVSYDVLVADKRLIWRVFATSISINMFLNYHYSVMRGNGKIKEINQTQILSKILMLVVNIGLLLNGYGLWSVSISHILSSMFVLVVLTFKVNNIIKEVNIERNHQSFVSRLLESKETLKKIWYTAYREGVVTLSNYINNQFGTVLVSMTGDMTQTALYSTCVQFVNIISNVSVSYSVAMRPKIQSMFAKGRKEEAIKYIGVCFVIFYSIFWAGTLAVLLFGVDVLALLQKDLVINPMMYLIISLYTFLSKNHSLSAQVICDMNKLPYVKAYVVSSTISLVLSFILIKNTSLGIYGYIISVAVVQLCYNNWKWPNYMSKQLGMPFNRIIVRGIKEIFRKIKVRKVRK